MLAACLFARVATARKPLALLQACSTLERRELLPRAWLLKLARVTAQLSLTACWPERRACLRSRRCWRLSGTTPERLRAVGSALALGGIGGSVRGMACGFLRERPPGEPGSRRRRAGFATRRHAGALDPRSYFAERRVLRAAGWTGGRIDQAGGSVFVSEGGCCCAAAGSSLACRASSLSAARCALARHASGLRMPCACGLEGAAGGVHTRLGGARGS